jgi:hypothetical protein
MTEIRHTERLTELTVSGARRFTHQCPHGRTYSWESRLDVGVPRSCPGCKGPLKAGEHANESMVERVARLKSEGKWNGGKTK